MLTTEDKTSMLVLTKLACAHAHRQTERRSVRQTYKMLKEEAWLKVMPKTFFFTTTIAVEKLFI